MTSSAPEVWVLEQQIAEAAYYLWLNNGCPSDKSLEYWLQARKDVLEAYGLSDNSEDEERRLM